LRAVVETAAPAGELAALPLDLDRYVAAEPRLRSARWINADGPAVGARASLTADIPFTIPLVRRHFGMVEVIATLIDWTPAESLEVKVAGKDATGSARIRVDATARGSIVHVCGEIEPTRATARLALRPLTPVLELLANRAIERGVRRAADAVVRPQV
jgi:hypothetical protein